MADRLLQWPLCSAPMLPSQGKWTKTGPAMDWFVVSSLFGWFRSLLISSMAPMSMDDPTQGAGAANYEDVVSSTDFDWKQVAGVR
eukprot:8249800-Heterocapsa_arctica.AAC.1